MHRRGRTESGFTVLEALMAVAVMSTVVVAALLFFATNGTAYRAGQVRSESHQNARIGLDEMEREIRMAGYDLSGVLATLPNPTGIQTGEANRLALVAELTGNGNTVLDQVTYRLQGNQLVRDFASWNGAAFGAATTGVVADGITTLAFQYFDDNDVALAMPVAAASLDDVARITMTVVTTETATSAQASFPLTVDVRLRNAD